MAADAYDPDDLKAVFSKFDGNGDGTLDINELKRVLLVCNPKFSEQEMDCIMQEADKNRDGRIDYAEFADWLASDQENASILGVRAIDEEVLRNHQKEYADSKQEIEALRAENEQLRKKLSAIRESERQLRAELRDLRLSHLDSQADKKAHGKQQRQAHEKAKQAAKDAFLEPFDPILRDLIEDAAVIQQEANALDDSLEGGFFTDDHREFLKDISSRYDGLARRAMQELAEDMVKTAREGVRQTELSFRQVYVSILELIRQDEQVGYGKTVSLLQTLPSKPIANSVSTVADLIDEATKAQPRVSELAHSIGVHVDALKMQHKPVSTSGKRKKLGRIQEKLNNSALRREDASRVYDCARAMMTFESMEAVHAALEQICAQVTAGSIAIDRVKDRFSKPSGGGWADAMINFHFVGGEAAGHVCEFQLVHNKLLLARAGLGGHDAYGAFRATLELLELLDDVEAACRGDQDWAANHTLQEWAEVRAYSRRPPTSADSSLMESLLRLGDEEWAGFQDLLESLPGGAASWAFELAKVVAPRAFPAAAAFARRCGAVDEHVRSLQQRRGGFVTASISDHSARAWDATTGMELQRFQHDLETRGSKAGSVEGVAWSPHGEFVYTTYNPNAAEGTRGLAKKWEMETGKDVLTYDGSFPCQTRCIALSACGRHLFIGGNNGQLLQFDEQSGDVLMDFSLRADSNVLELAVSLDNRYLYAAHGTVVKKLDLRVDQDEQSPLRRGTTNANATFSTTMSSLKAKEPEPVVLFRGHGGAIVGLALGASEERELLSSGSTDRQIFVWDASTGQILHKLKVGITPKSMVFTRDGKYLYAPGKSKKFDRWDMTSGRIDQSFSGHAAAVTCVALSGDNAFAYTGSEDKTAKKWDTQTGNCVLTFSGHTAAISELVLPAW
eukprot:TRINITY_DN4284_c0_g1_i1.p1 TRINITY_DN4284_c0_g1~~TRINITY_DN4284_c0_g1_i1.p1  ORF type:complete len:903 (-),score=169.33 TRINITY_DN4284_c0_g1_i1:656-3364(-)